MRQNITTRRHSVDLVTVALAFLMAACDAKPGGDAGPGATPIPEPAPVAAPIGVKACDLITNQDAKDATSTVFKPGVVTNDYAGDSQCRFDRESGTDGGIMVSLHEHGDLKNYENVPGSTVVNQLGDGAVWNDNTGQLAVRRDSAVFSISLLSQPANKQHAIALARRALKRF